MIEDERRATLLRAAIGLDGPVAPRQGDWSAWEWLARTERVIPLLAQVLTLSGADVADEARRSVRQLHGGAMSRVVELEHHLLRIVGFLHGAGVPFAVLKGAATAHLDYQDPSMREFADIDLLVGPGDLRAVSALVGGEEGWIQGYALPRHHEQFTHAVTLVRDRMELDLHQRIAHRALGLLAPTEELLARRVPYFVAGAELHALSAPDRLIHAAIHSATSGAPERRLSSLADVLVLAEDHGHLAGETLERAERWRLRSILEAEIRLAFESAQLGVPDAWSEAMGAPFKQTDCLVDLAYLSPYRRPVVEELAYLRLLRGWRNRVRYLGGYLATDPEYAAQHARSGLRAQIRYLGAKVRRRA